mgnify:CR=1 FL=1
MVAIIAIFIFGPKTQIMLIEMSIGSVQLI